jgi:hypothetical protein
MTDFKECRKEMDDLDKCRPLSLYKLPLSVFSHTMVYFIIMRRINILSTAKVEAAVQGK